MTTTNKDQSIKSFIFYRSFYKAIETLSSKNRLIAYDAIIRYAFYGEEPTDLQPRVFAIFTMAMPQIDANRKKFLKRIANTPQTNNNETIAIFEEEVPLPKKEKEIIIPSKKNNDETTDPDEFGPEIVFDGKDDLDD